MSTWEWGSRWSARGLTAVSASVWDTGAALPTVMDTGSGRSVLGPAGISRLV